MNGRTCQPGERKQLKHANVLSASWEASISRKVSCSTTTSVNQTRELEEALGILPPSSEDAVKCWCDLHSLEALRLTLPHIIESCKPPNQDNILEEYPFARHLTPLGTSQRVPFPSQVRSQAHLDEDKLHQKQRQLKLLIKFYENRIHSLCIGSNKYFGVVKGSKLAILIEASQALAQLEEGEKFKEYKDSLKLFVKEQLCEKEAVYFIQFGTVASPKHPELLPFEVSLSRCQNFADQWLTALSGHGSCNLLAALKVALSLEKVDTICVVLCTKPNQDLSLVHDHLTDKLAGYSSPKLHLVAFDTSQEISSALANMANTLKGHFHGYNSKSSDSSCEHQTYSVQDTDIDQVRKEIEKTKQVIHDLHNLKKGVIKDPLLSTLRELSLTTEWAEDDNFHLPAPPTEAHAQPHPSFEWLEHHGLESHGLDLYKILAPNAYPQLNGRVQVTDSWVLSQVYDVMPLFPWHDGTHKYLHVDVHGLEHYTRQLQDFITNSLELRLGWLLSGSRMPFGVLTEQRVLLVMDCSFPVLAQILVLQQHMKTLLQEQLSLIKEFNLMRFGKECCVWTNGFAELNKHSLREAWEFVLGMSPNGSCDLLAALRIIFETDQIFEAADQSNEVGIYLIVSSFPDQDEEMISSYLEQHLAGRDIKVHIVYYDMEHLTNNLVVPGRECGRYGTSKNVEECLERIARTTRGRFHHFKVSGSAEGDDIKVILAELSLAHRFLETANNILQHYREFCKREGESLVEFGHVLDIDDVSQTYFQRNVPATEPRCMSPPEVVKSATPPLYPRQTATSLARMNVCQQKLSPPVPAENRPASQSGNRKGRKVKTKKLFLKTQPFYTGQGIKKAFAQNLLERSKSTKAKPHIPKKEAYLSSKDWLSKYSLESLGLRFDNLLPSNNYKGTVHKHINQQGEHVELCVSHQGMRNYLSQLLTLLNRYQARVDWLQKEEHKYFGAVLESKVIFILDASSSMSSHWTEVKEGVKKLLHSLPLHIKSFNVIVFASTVKKWKETSVIPVKSALDDVLVWLDSLKSGGSSCLLEAFKTALISGAEGLYLVTDGEADHTHEFLLNQLPKLRQQFGEQWILNTAGFYCTNNHPQSFLKLLAHSTGGRFHSYPQLSIGDDLSLVEGEVQAAQNCISRARTYL